MANNTSNQKSTTFSSNVGAAVYSGSDLGQNLQQSTNVVGAYGQYANNSQTSNPSSAQPPNGSAAKLAGLMSNSTSQGTARYTANGRPIPAGQSIEQAAQNSTTLQNSPQYHPPVPQNQNLQSAPLTYVNSSVNQYKRPVAPPQNRPQSISSGQVFPQNQQPYQQRPQNRQQPQQPQKRGLFGGGGNPPKAVDKNNPEYLRRLTTDQLRKEIIQTEIDVQKTLIQTEKAYREGIATIKDLIAPSSIKVTTGSLEIGTKHIRTFFVLTYPRVISSGWLEGVVNADVPMDLSIFVYPRDSAEVLRELKGKVGKIQASLQINQEKGMARDPQLETAYRDVEGLRDAIQQGVEKFFRVGVYITIYADTTDQLEKYSQSIEGMLSQQSIIMKRAALQMDDGFNSSLPILKDDLYVVNNMNTSPLSASFPFVSSELSSNEGILYGINRHNNSLIIFDRFELENANSLIFATSGAGKSYTVKLEILRSLMLGVSVIVIDPEQEYKVLCDQLGGVYVNMSLNSVNRVNPFDLPKALPGESTADILRSAIVDLMGLMNLMLGKLNPTEESVMERAIKECYAKRDITDNSDLNNIVSPTMSDLVEILQGIVGGESLAQRLYKYTEGTFAGIFNQRSNVDINNPFVVFNIRDLQEGLRPIAMYVLLKFIWNEIRSSLKRRILAVDEAWIMMQYEDSARFLYGLVKRARKYYLGVTTITQDVGDFLNSPFGKPIVTNAAMKILLKQSSAAIDTIADTFALTTGEKQVLLQSEVGQGIFFAGPRHVAIDIIAFPREHTIITTNPKEVLQNQDLDKI
jgi:conjugal transfer ATP-binding protein TraC